jgi:hypothetical protein
MAAKPKSGGGGGILAGLTAVLAAGLIGLLVWLYGETTREEQALDRVKREYREMVDRMKPAVTQMLKIGKQPSSGPANEDLLTFLSRKSNQAGIPASIFKIQPNQPLKSGGWRETSYTVNLQGAKDAPVLRSAVADFVRFVESERPALRVKSLSLSFAGNDLSQAAVTFSAFDREGSP